MATPKGITNPYGTGANPKLTLAKPTGVNQPWTHEQIMSDPGYVGKDLVQPEDREYLEGFMNRYYPNQGANDAANDRYARDLETKQMADKGYNRTPGQVGYTNAEGQWTSGPSFKDSAYWKNRDQFTTERKEILLNEIKRKYPNWPADYQERVANDVFSKWYWNAVDNYNIPNKDSTQNIANAVQGVM